jgi:hypothetical protein
VDACDMAYEADQQIPIYADENALDIVGRRFAGNVPL